MNFKFLIVTVFVFFMVNVAVSAQEPEKKEETKKENPEQVVKSKTPI